MKMILMTVGVLWTSTVFSQYFSKTYPDPVRRPLISNIECDNNYLSITIEIISCDDGMHQCCQISGINQDGSRAWQKYKSYFKGNQYTLKIRHDTVFYSGNSNVLPDSMMYWYFGMMHTNGDSIAEYRYPILHLKDTGIGSFGYKIPYNYGMTLVNNNEVILWGEGLDIRMPLPNPKVYRRSVFQRIGINGERKGEPFWFEASNFIFRRMSDACTDIDGNMVFNYEYVTTPDINNDNGCRRGIFKIMPDNSIDTIVKVTQDALNSSLPKIAIDSHR